MKIKRIIAVFLAFIVVLFLSACFSGWRGMNEGEGRITINLGNTARAFVNLDNNEFLKFSHEITLMDSKKVIIKQEKFSGNKVSFNVPADSYTVTIKAYDDGGLRAYGITPNVNVINGQNKNTQVIMYSASEVNNMEELSAVFSEMSDISDTDAAREYYVLIKDTLNAVSDNINTINLRRGKITLIAETDVSIHTPMFNIYEESILQLGVKGMAGTIELIGSKDTRNPLIKVIGILEMNDGVTLKENLNNEGNGGAVLVCGMSAFFMHGGIITGNSAQKGGGVYLDVYGTFKMSGGVISGNTAAEYGGGVYIEQANFYKEGGGIIYGENSGSNANKAKEEGHAVFADGAGEEGDIVFMYRNKTLETGDNISCYLLSPPQMEFVGVWENINDNTFP